MKKIKLCCFTVNSTHAYIIANNFINNEFENVKVIYINEKTEKRKIKKIINKYENEKFVFVVNGNEEFIEKVNKFLDINDCDGYIINCYNISDIKCNINCIINSHDFYINTTGVIKKEVLKYWKK